MKSKTDILAQIVIAIDGVSGSGKTTTARAVADRLGLHHIDTGAMYRAITCRALRSGVRLDDAEAIGRIADEASLSFVEEPGSPQRVILDGEDVTEAIRSVEVTAKVSLVSIHRGVRKSMVRRQRSLSEAGGVVLEGRDIGSVVLPSADVKVYLDASLEVRAKRRMKELRGRGVAKEAGAVERDLAERDHRDRNRDVSPLKVPIGAEIIDTTNLTIEEQVGRVIRLAEQRADGLLAMLPKDGDKNPATKRRFYFSVVQFLARVGSRVAWGLRVVRKAPFIYNENYIFASNHRSNADPPLVGSNVPRDVYFVAKEALFRVKGLGWLITRLNSVPVRRTGFSRATMDACIELLVGGKSVLIFPEGGRVVGNEPGRSRPGVGFLALNSGVAVVPVYVEGTGRLRGALFRRPRVTVIFGRPMRPTNADLSCHQNANDYREFGEMVMCGIEALKDEQELEPRRDPA